MDIFGHCPAHDEFYLVVCNHCSQVVKPQAFQKHCGEPGNSGNGYSTPWCWEQHWECHRGWLWGYSLREGTVVGGLVWAKGGLFPSHPVPSRPDPTLLAERRHGPLSKLYARATACHVAVNGQPVPGGTPGAAKALQEKHPGARGRAQPLPEHTDKDNNLW